MNPSLPLVIDQALGWVGGRAVERPATQWWAEHHAGRLTPSAPPPVGTVVGTLLNHRAALQALGDAVHAPPYKAPPRAPVLYLKPRHCHVGHGQPVIVPQGIDELEVGATLGIVIGRKTCRVPEADALRHVAGYLVANDLCVPHASLYRPSLRCRCRDTFMALGAWIVGARHVADPDDLELRVEIDGRTALRTGTGGMLRPVARLIADVSAFMTLDAGDVLLLGVAAGAPRACAGQRVRIVIDGVGVLDNPLVAEAVA